MLILSIFAGLGLFFVGLKSLNQHLKKLAGKHVRTLATRAVRHPWSGIIWGSVAGFATQSGRTTSFLVAGIVQGGILSFPQALPLVLWSNFGCTLIVFAAILPFDLMILAALGLFGIGFAFEYPRKGTLLSGALFGIALLLFGLGMISGATKELLHTPWFSPAIAWINASLVIGFAIGLLLTVIAQSHTAIVLMAIAMTQSGILDPIQAAMVILGTHGGSSVITYLLSVQLRGQARQLVYAQIFYNIVGIAVFMPLVLIESLTSTPLLLSAIATIDSEPGLQAALFAIILNITMPIIIMLGRVRYQRIIERFIKIDDLDKLAQPKYLSSELEGDPETTLLLLEKEQLRLMKRLPWYLDSLRPADERSHPTDSSFSPANLHQAFISVHHEIEQTTATLLGEQLGPKLAESVLNMQNRQSLVAALEECLVSLCYQPLHNERAKTPAQSSLTLLSQIVESLDAQILTTLSARMESDRSELDLVIKLTADSGPTMGEIRSRYLSQVSTVSPTERTQILHITNTFERATWALHRYAILLARAFDELTGWQTESEQRDTA